MSAFCRVSPDGEHCDHWLDGEPCCACDTRQPTHDCFGNATPGIPPSISDTFHDIQTYAPIPFDQRMAYHYARTDAMVGRAPVERAWGLLRRMNLELRRAER